MRGKGNQKRQLRGMAPIEGKDKENDARAASDANLSGSTEEGDRVSCSIPSSRRVSADDDSSMGVAGNGSMDTTTVNDDKENAAPTTEDPMSGEIDGVDVDDSNRGSGHEDTSVELMDREDIGSPGAVANEPECAAGTANEGSSSVNGTTDSANAEVGGNGCASTEERELVAVGGAVDNEKASHDGDKAIDAPNRTPSGDDQKKIEHSNGDVKDVPVTAEASTTRSRRETDDDHEPGDVKTKNAEGAASDHAEASVGRGKESAGKDSASSSPAAKRADDANTGVADTQGWRHDEILPARAAHVTEQGASQRGGVLELRGKGESRPRRKSPRVLSKRKRHHGGGGSSPSYPSRESSFLLTYTCNLLRSQSLDYEVRGREFEEKCAVLDREIEAWEKKARSLRRKLEELQGPERAPRQPSSGLLTSVVSASGALVTAGSISASATMTSTSGSVANVESSADSLVPVAVASVESAIQQELSQRRRQIDEFRDSLPEFVTETLEQQIARLS